MERFPESRIPGVTRFMDFVIVHSVGYYTPLGRNRDSSARFRSIRFTDLIVATRGNDTLPFLFSFIERNSVKSNLSTLPFRSPSSFSSKKKREKKLNRVIWINRSQKKESTIRRWKKRGLLAKFPCEWLDASFGAVILFFKSKQAYPYSQIPLAMIDTGFLEHACVVQPHESSIGVAGTGGERAAAMATRQEGSSTLPPQSLLRH